MPTTYEDLYDKDGTIYKKGVEGGLDTPYAKPEDLAVDLGVGSSEIDWGAIGQYAPPPVPQDIPAGATAEDILGQDAYGDELAGAEAGYYETLTPEYRQESRAQSDADIMKKYQQEIDALETERVAARGRITSQYGQIGKERQGTSTAIQARRGLVGSTFGTQQKREVQSQTQREQDAAMAYSSALYAERKRAIMGDVRTAQADEAKLRLEAAQLGSQAKIEEIRGRKERSDERISTAVKNMLGMDIDIEDEETMAEVAEGLGISVKDLMSKYKSVKSEAEEAQRILDEEQLDREVKRNLTQSQIDKIENDRKMIEKKFEQDKIEFGLDYAMQEQELALDTWKAEQKQALDLYKATKPREERDGMTDAQLRARAKEFETQIDKATKQLQSGESWGSVWDSIRRQFPEEEISNEEIDEILGGGMKTIQPTDELGQPISSAYRGGSEEWGWARPGAYEEHQSQKTVQNVPQWQYEEGVRSGMTFAERDRILSGDSKTPKTSSSGLNYFDKDS